MTAEARVLPPYSGNKAVCAKCGTSSHRSGGHYTEWVPPQMVSSRGMTVGECLERRCVNCGYAWAEAVVKAVVT